MGDFLVILAKSNTMMLIRLLLFYRTSAILIHVTILLKYLFSCIFLLNKIFNLDRFEKGANPFSGNDW